MKIMFDLTVLKEKPTGILNVTENIVTTYIRLFPQNQYVLVFQGKIMERFPIRTESDNVKIIVQTAPNQKRLYHLPKIMRESDADWIICASYPGPVLLNDPRVISVVHDLTCWKHPETMNWKLVRRWRAMIRHAVRTNRYILNVSETVANEVRAKFHNKNSVAICNGVNITEETDESILEKFSLKKDGYIHSVATLEPRKNLTVLLDAFSRMENRGNVKLVLTGAAGWKLQDALGENADMVGSENLVFTGYVSNAELNALYRNAKLFVSASVYEGFGLPVIEAVRNNLPVLVSDIPVYREITNGLARYFPCHDAGVLAKRLEECLGQDLRREPEFAELQEFAKQYTWENYVNKLNQLLENTPPVK